jgi:23S rRNA pseudouridine2605 synthase
MQRINSYLVSCGLAPSRRKAEELIKEGLVKVNGKTITNLATQVSDTDKVSCEGVSAKKETLVYLILNKQKGYICTKSDPKKRRTIFDLIGGEFKNYTLHSVGRLDYDTSGIIILTNDGNFTQAAAHPSKNIVKSYIADIDKPISINDIRKIKSGVNIDGRIATAKISKLVSGGELNRIKLDIVEGRYHIVKRILNNFGYEVKNLKREKFGKLEAKNILPGKYKQITKKEAYEGIGAGME